MKLRNKVFAGLAATVLALTMLVGTAMASTDQLPFAYPNEANAATDNDVWVKLIGGGTVISTTEVADATRTVDITVEGKCSFEPELIFNFDGGWVPTAPGVTDVDGSTVLTMPMNGKGTTWCEVVVNLKNKTEGALAVTKMEFKDEAGAVLLTWPADAGAAATDDAAATPKTGVVSLAFVFGLGAAVMGTGSVVLKKKER
ncbi:MAG: hypothetical protein K0R46_321 [Herbinix sp.]|jgi:hypothetical protein|nr:hypothetical protein [Herbinix sp.]